MNVRQLMKDLFYKEAAINNQKTEEETSKDDGEAQPTCKTLVQQRKEDALQKELPEKTTFLTNYLDKTKERKEVETSEDGSYENETTTIEWRLPTKPSKKTVTICTEIRKGRINNNYSSVLRTITVSYGDDKVLELRRGKGRNEWSTVDVHAYKPGDWTEELNRIYEEKQEEKRAKKRRSKSEELRTDWGINPDKCRLTTE